MTQDQHKKLEYAISHNPIRYVVERKWAIFWVVKNIDGDIIHTPTIWKFLAVSRKDFYNAVFSYGYKRGCNAVLKSINS